MVDTKTPSRSNKQSEPKVGKQKYYAIENTLKSNQDNVIIGQFDTTANRPMQGSYEAVMKPASYLIPNFSRVWGKRVKDQKNNYSGECVFDKPWGEGDGYESIEIRFAKNSTSLDKQYQESKGIKVPDEDLFIEISADISYVDVPKEPVKALFFSICSLNGDSVCRNPSADVMFHNYDPQRVVNQQLKSFELETDAMNLVKQAKDDEDVAYVLADMFGISSQIVHEDIVTALMTKMRSNPANFLKTVQDTVEAYKSMLFKAERYGILGTGTPGLIQIKKGEGYDILFDEVDSPDDQKVEWIMSGVFSSAVYDKIQQISNEVTAFEQKN